MSFFKMKEYDDLGENNILSRAGTINAFGHIIDTPIPIPTNFDLEKLIEIRKAVGHLKKLEFSQPIIEIDRFFYKETLKNLEKSPSASERLKNQIDDICDQTKLSMLRFILSRDMEFSDKLNDIHKETQIQTQISFMLINDIKFNSSINAFDKRISETREYIESHHDKEKYCSISPVIRIDMPMNLLEQKINVICDNGFDGIVFEHTPFYNAFKQYLYIQKIAKEKDNMWFHLAGCMPTLYKSKKASLPHFYTSVFGFDTVSVLQPRRFIPKKKGKIKPMRKKKSKPKFKKFNNTNWGLVEPSEWSKCDCPVDKDHKKPNSFIRTWHGSGLINNALIYHNLTDGNREMGIGRKFTMHKELREYLRNKEHIAQAVKSVLGKDFNQGNLKKWL